MIGQRLKVGIVDYTIVGVAPRDFVGVTDGAPPDVFVPLTTIPANLGAWSQESFSRDYSWDWVQMIVRRKPGVDARSGFGRAQQCLHSKPCRSARAESSRTSPIRSSVPPPSPAR